MCIECYVDAKRITPLRNPIACLQEHTQYICSTCGRCICIERDPRRGLQRWNFPFNTLENAKLYLRTADYTMKTTCGIYEIKNDKGRISYKIFEKAEALHMYLQKNHDKHCDRMAPVFCKETYVEYLSTQVRKLTAMEIETYMSERIV